MSDVNTTCASNQASLQQSLRCWIHTQLPDLPDIPDETLDLLMQHDVTQRLFRFLTTRVHTASRARDIRAVLELARTGDSDADDGEHDENGNDSNDEDQQHDRTVAELRQKIASAQDDLSTARADLTKKPRCSRQSARSKEDALNDGYDGVFTGRGGKACKTRAAARRILKQRLDLVRQMAGDAYGLFGAYDMSSGTLSGTSPSSKLSPSSASGARVSTIAGQLHAHVSALTADALMDAPDDTHLLAHINDMISGDDAHTVARLLQPAVREAARRRAYSCESNFEDMTRTSLTEQSIAASHETGHEEKPVHGYARTSHFAMETARDVQLRAGAVWRARGRAATAAAARVESLERKRVGKSDYGHMSGLYARMDGERAVLEYATQASVAGDWAAIDGNSSDVDEVSQLRQQRESAYIAASNRIDKLEQAIARISGGSLRALEAAVATAQQDVRYAPLVRDATRRAVREARHAADIVESAVEGTRRWHGSGAGDGRVGDIECDEDINATNLRMAAVDNWRKASVQSLKNLRIRSDVVAENRLQTMQKVESRLANIVSDAVKVEGVRRETQAMSALHELRTWAAEPAKEVVRQLVTDKG